MAANDSPHADRMTESEYETLKNEQKITRLVGAALLCVALPLYPLFITKDVPTVVLPVAVMQLTGAVLFARSFVHAKFRALKYDRRDAPSGAAAGPQTARSTDTARKAPDKPAVKAPVKAAKNPPEKAPVNSPVKAAQKAVADRIRGCLLGGAAGDALGYPVEFLRYGSIVKKYGAHGIADYALDPVTGKALISDDTQMTLFTAEGLLQPEGEELSNIYRAYQNWLITQKTSYRDRPAAGGSALMEFPELFSCRAPGNTCLSALSFGTMGTVTNPINASKGCGGVMRVAPVAFLNDRGVLALDKLGAQAAAITHGHPLGYLPAALLVHILHKAIYEIGVYRPLRAVVGESVREFAELFSAAPYLSELLAIVNKAILLSENKLKDVENIRALGEGWVAEETLAVAVYCALRHQDDFSAALTAAVNHDGDSDSTGAVTGNLLGAYLGESLIDAKWKTSLELYDVLSDTADAFCP